MGWRRLLDQVRRRGSLSHALRVRTPLCHPDFPAVVMWSEKAACTVAVKWFFHHIGKLDEALAYQRWVHRYENDVFKAQPGYREACAAMIRAGRPVVKFVRNPYTRAFSGYLELCRPDVLEKEDHWSGDTRRKIVSHLFGEGADAATPFSFNQFAGWMAAQRPDTLDYHLAPQFMSLEKRVSVEVVRLEDHDNPFAFVEARFGLPSSRDEIRIYMSGHHHRKREVSDAAALAALDEPLPLARPHSAEVFDPSPQAVAASPGGAHVRQVSARSFAAYGYDPLA